MSASSTLALPAGWTREEVAAPSGLSTGKTRVYYISPDGVVVRSLPELQKFFENSFDLKDFDWRTGRNIPGKNKRPFLQTSSFSTESKLKKLDGMVSRPRRRKEVPPPQNSLHPVIHRLHPNSRVTEVKDNPHEIPRQLFWMKFIEQKRLLSQPIVGDSSADQSTPARKGDISLPLGLQVYPNSVNSSEAAWINAVQHLYTKKHFVGQQLSKASFEKPLWLSIAPDQPFIVKHDVSDKELSQQDSRVAALRKKLASLREKYVQSSSDGKETV